MLERLRLFYNGLPFWGKCVVWWHGIALLLSIGQKIGADLGRMPDFNEIMRRLLGGDKKPLFILSPFLLIWRAILFVIWLIGVVVIAVVVIPLLSVVWLAWSMFRYLVSAISYLLYVLWKCVISKPAFWIMLVGTGANFSLIYVALTGIQGGGWGSFLTALGLTVAESAGAYFFVVLLKDRLLESIINLRVLSAQKSEQAEAPSKQEESLARMRGEAQKTIVWSAILLAIIVMLLPYAFKVDYQYNVTRYEVERQLLMSGLRGMYGRADEGTISKVLTHISEHTDPRALGWATVLVPLICGFLGAVLSKPTGKLSEFRVYLPKIDRALKVVINALKHSVGELKKASKFFLVYLGITVFWVYFLVDGIVELIKRIVRRKKKDTEVANARK